MFATGKSAASVVEERGLVQVSDTGEIDRVIDEVITRARINLNSIVQVRKLCSGSLLASLKASRGKAESESCE